MNRLYLVGMYVYCEDLRRKIVEVLRGKSELSEPSASALDAL